VISSTFNGRVKSWIVKISNRYYSKKKKKIALVAHECTPDSKHRIRCPTRNDRGLPLKYIRSEIEIVFSRQFEKNSKHFEFFFSNEVVEIQLMSEIISNYFESFWQVHENMHISIFTNGRVSFEIIRRYSCATNIKVKFSRFFCVKKFEKTEKKIFRS